MEAVNDRLIERLDFGVFIARRLRIDVSDVAVRWLQFHVYVFGLVEALRKKARSNE